MAEQVKLRVDHLGEERVVVLRYDEKGWHANVMIPGQEDLFTGERPSASPSGTVLPKLEIEGMELRIEVPSGKVASLAVARLTACGQVFWQDDQLRVPLKSLMTAYGDDVGSRDARPGGAQILEFPRTRESREEERSR